MNLRKHQIYNHAKRVTIVVVMLVVATIGIAPPAPATAHHAQECSDVFTPLSNFVMDGVAANKDAYVQVMNDTGVPWELLAAIHYRETSFGRSNPSNGQGIFQFVNGDGGPYPTGPVDETEFRRQLRFMANKLQDDYVWRGSVSRDRRKLQPNETNVALVKDTLFSYNGRAGVYADQSVHFGFNRTDQPYEGSPYVMNRFDCQRARMGLITRDYGSMDGTDTRYGAFTVFSRLRGDAYWRSLLPFYSEEINMSDAQRRIQTLTYNGQIYTFYYDGLQQVLRMATADPQHGWQFTILDGTTTGGNGRRLANMGSSLSATVFNNAIHIVYYDKTNGNLRYGTFNGTTWDFLNLDGDTGSLGGKNADVGVNPSIAAFEGSLQIIYFDRTNTNLRHSWYAPGQGWRFENLDGDRGSVSGYESEPGAFTAMTSYRDSLQLFYYDQYTQNVRHAWITTSKGWQFEDLDGAQNNQSAGRTTTNVGISPTAGVYRDSLQLFYYDQDRTNLRHAWTDPNRGWQFEDFDGDGNTASSKWFADSGITSSVAASNNLIQVFNYDRSNRNLRIAGATPQTGWSFLNLDGDRGSIGGQDGDAGTHVGALVVDDNYLQAYYYNRTTGALRHAWTDASGWRFEDLGPTVIY